MGSPWRPKCIQVRKKTLNWTFSPPVRGPFLGHVRENYGKEPFVDVMERNTCPETKSVRASNMCRISFYKVPDTNQLVILSVIDNLVKGAAGQAVQNMNIMMRWKETLGLESIPLAP